MYYVNISSEAEKFINKLDNSISKKVYKKISKLKNNPENQGDVIRPVKEGIRELKYAKFRVYYYIDDDVVEIAKIVYDGKVEVLYAGDKKSQKKDISKSRIKNRFSRLIRRS